MTHSTVVQIIVMASLVAACTVQSHVATTGDDAGIDAGGPGVDARSAGTDGGPPAPRTYAKTRFTGDAFGDIVGGAFVGDLDGDGLDDFVIGDRMRSHVAEQAGSVYLFYGRADRFPDVLSVRDADAELRGETAYAAASVAHGAGDFDGDGYDDFVVGAPHTNDGDGGTGAAYVVFGGPERLTGPRMLSDVGARIDPPDPRVAIGMRVSGAGDVDGDGLDDVLISAPYDGETWVGDAYLFRGRSTRPASPLSLGDADARFHGSAGGWGVHLGASIAGDVDGDGLADIAVQLAGAPDSRHALALFYGRSSFSGDYGPGDADAILEAPHLRWHTMGPAGDFDWDGHADLVLPAGPAMHVVYGGASRFAGTLDGIGAARWTLTPEDETHSYLGAGLGFGDFDGDGVDDLFVGDPHNPAGGGVQAGALYVLYGAWGRRYGELAASESDVLLRGTASGEEGRSDELGYGVSGGGDVDGDGRSEVLVAAGTNAIGDEDAGAVWLVYGAGRFDRYARCHYDLADPESHDTCGPVGGGVSGEALGSGIMGCLCTIRCVTDVECPRPSTGTATPVCDDTGSCRLPCASGATCPDGMSCAPGMDSCLWPSP